MCVCVCGGGELAGSIRVCSSLLVALATVCSSLLVVLECIVALSMRKGAPSGPEALLISTTISTMRALSSDQSS